MNHVKKLEPCPFCGAEDEAFVFKNAEGWGVCCGACFAERRGYPSHRAAREAWNSRANSGKPNFSRDDFELEFYESSKCDFCRHMPRKVGVPWPCDWCQDFDGFEPAERGEE